MPSINPGPAVTATANSELVLTPINTLGTTNPPQAANQLRLLTSFRAVSLSGLGDVALGPIVNSSNWVAATIVVTNGLVNGVSATVAAASLGIFTAANAGGSAIRAAGVLTGQTLANVVTVSAASVLVTSFTVQNLFLNVGVVVAGGTVDIFVYGYDLS